MQIGHKSRGNCSPSASPTLNVVASHTRQQHVSSTWMRLWKRESWHPAPLHPLNIILGDAVILESLQKLQWEVHDPPLFCSKRAELELEFHHLFEYQKVSAIIQSKHIYTYIIYSILIYSFCQLLMFCLYPSRPGQRQVLHFAGGTLETLKQVDGDFVPLIVRRGKEQTNHLCIQHRYTHTYM